MESFNFAKNSIPSGIQKLLNSQDSILFNNHVYIDIQNILPLFNVKLDNVKKLCKANKDLYYIIQNSTIYFSKYGITILIALSKEQFSLTLQDYIYSLINDYETQNINSEESTSLNKSIKSFCRIKTDAEIKLLDLQKKYEELYQDSKKLATYIKIKKPKIVKLEKDILTKFSDDDLTDEDEIKQQALQVSNLNKKTNEYFLIKSIETYNSKYYWNLKNSNSDIKQQTELYQQNPEMPYMYSHFWYADLKISPSALNILKAFIFDENGNSILISTQKMNNLLSSIYEIKN